MQKTLIKWLADYADRTPKKVISERLGYDWSVIYKVINGKYDASLDNFLTAVKKLKDAVSTIGGEIIPTIATKKIIETLQNCKATSSMGVISGPTGRGKTLIAQNWALTNSGDVHYMRMPSACRKHALVRTISTALGIGASRTTKNLEAKILQRCNRNTTLIIDEAGHLLPRSSSASATTTLDYLRDIHDICGCGIIMIFTSVYWGWVETGSHRDFLEQFMGRIKYRCMIPQKILKDEIRAILSTAIPTPTNKILKLAYTIANNGDGKLRTLFDDLQKAQKFAKKLNQQLSDAHLETARSLRLSGGQWPSI
jgi:DNA transposition AAA+ family ATPase